MAPDGQGEVFQSVDVGAGTTLFHRPAPGGTEGFVVDNRLLVETLKDRVLAERGLSEVVEVSSLSRDVGSKSLSGSVSETFFHDFAEPFSSLSANLSLAPLEAPVTETILVPITLALGVLIVLGLWALYRVVATQLEFARRQSNFVAAVSHELKTPLTAIRMHGEMLQEGLVESPEKAREYYKTITGQAERLSRLIGNVLLLSKIEKSAPVQPTSGDLAGIIESAVTALRPHVEKSGFELQLMLPGQMPRVLLDADSVEQILFNLVDNAVKYGSSAEDKRLTISAEVTQQHVSICVRDRGPGIPESERERIFEAFYRLEDELTRKNTGTGLGLALVADLASRMNATVRANNARPGLAVVVEFQRAR